MCGPRRYSRERVTQAIDLQFRASCERFANLIAPVQPKFQRPPPPFIQNADGGPVAETVPPRPPAALEAARDCRNTALRLNKLNGRRSDVSFAYRKEVVDAIVRTSLYILQHDDVFSFSIADEALILAGLENELAPAILSLVKAHAVNEPPPPPILTLEQFTKVSVPAPCPDSIMRVSNLSDFCNRFVLRGHPCVINLGVRSSTQITDILDAINNAADFRHVPAESSRFDIRAREWTLQIKTLREAIASGDYLAQFPLHKLLQIHVPSWHEFECPDSPAVVNCWLGPPNTKTPHHWDAYHNVYVAVAGDKFFQIARPGEEADKLFRPLSGGLNNMTSACDTPLVDHDSVAFDVWNVTLKPGDALYIPQGFWHMAQSLSWHLGTSTWVIHNDRLLDASRALWCT